MTDARARRQNGKDGASLPPRPDRSSKAWAEHE